ncbi:MAG TPA: S8 family serine peptidase [Bacteroidia bacterium]|jgi:cell wall-associated protease|nr:S8 family serine peptidase [Bacteroidia bacterium]
MQKLFILPFIFICSLAFSQGTDTTKAPENWFNLDPYADKVNGVSTERTYTELLKGKKSSTIIVAVIDGGVDYNHEDLKDVMWTNEKEIAGNGIDDDKNGYVDDIHGWNFLGGKDGKNVEKETLELTRIYKELKPKYDGKDEKSIASADKKEYQLYSAVKKEYEKRYNTAQAQLTQYKFIADMFTNFNLTVKEQLKVDTVHFAELEKYKAADKKEEQVVNYMKLILSEEKGASLDDILKQLEEATDHFENQIKYNLNTEFDPRAIIGDDYKNSSEKYYGNNDCKGPGASHGTHVAGIIAANRINNIGIKGVADNVRIMAVRAVPDGDERDKDIANAIIYAVDNGAKVINMSFGKGFPYDKAAVDRAVKYAESKDVLLIHAAGNDGLDIDVSPNYPCKKFASGGEAKNWIEVGASDYRRLPAVFSNYGKKTVTLFAPGVDIYSVKVDGGYVNQSGTSMACPVTAGVAAVIRSYFPYLTAKQVKKILEKSVVDDWKKDRVVKPGKLTHKVKKGDTIKSICSRYKIAKEDLEALNPELKEPLEEGDDLLIKEKVEVEFSELSVTGGIVNLYKAVQMAQKMSN